LNLLKAAFFVEGEPVGDRVTVNAEVAGGCGAAVHFPGLQKEQHVEAALDLGIALFAHPLLKFIDRLGDLREVVHRERGISE